MDVTLNSTLSWTPIVGAEYQTQVLDATNAVIRPPTDNGTATTVAIGILLAGQPAGQYKLEVRAMQPGGALMSPWVRLTVTLVAYEAPTGLTIS